MSLFSCSYSFSLYKSRKPCTFSWYAKCCKSERSNLIRWRFTLHLFCSTFWNTNNGNILPFFASSRKTKNPDFVWKSGFYCLLLFFKVVPPGIEPFNLIYSNSLIDSIFLLYILWKPLNWLYTKFIAFLYQFDNHYPFDSAKIEKMFDFRKNISVFLLIKFSIG